MKKIIFIGLILVFAGARQPLAGQDFSGKSAAENSASQTVKMSEEEKVKYLINYLRNLTDATFIRNGAEYSPGKAADHLQSKWNKHRNKVKTAQGFVERLATASKSDEPYTIRRKNGTTEKCGDVLKAELDRIENSK